MLATDGLTMTKTMGNEKKQMGTLHPNDYEAQIALLQKQLVDKDKMLRRENKADFSEKEATVLELMVKGYAKENERLLSSQQNAQGRLQEMEKVLKSTGFQKSMPKSFQEGSFPFEKEEMMKETIKKLQDELIKQDDHYRKREQETKEKLTKMGGLEEVANNYLKNLEQLKDQIEAVKYVDRRKTRRCLR